MAAATTAQLNTESCDHPLRPLIMRSNRRPSTATSTRPQWRQFTDFLVRRRARILLTIFLALFADYWGGRLLQHNLADVHDPKVLLGLAWVFAGCALLAWAAGSKGNQIQSTGNWPYTLVEEPRYIGLLVSMLGLCLLIDDPKNICLLLGPVILLDLIRVRREDYDALQRFHSQRPSCDQLPPTVTPSWLSIAAGSVKTKVRGTLSSITALPRTSLITNDSGHADWLLRSRRYAPLLIVPVVALAVIGYAWPFDSLEFHETWEIRCLLLSFVGLAIRMLAAGHMPGNSSGPENSRLTSTLNTDGLFSIVRHPRYLADFGIGLGVVLIPFVWWLPVIYSLAFCLYFTRIIGIEEEGLRKKFGKRFDEWAAVTPALFPRLSQWRPANRPFSIRTALKHEHPGLFIVIALHSSIEWLEHLILDRRVMLEVFWIVLAVVGLTAYLLVRHLEKHTHVLNVQPR